MECKCGAFITGNEHSCPHCGRIIKASAPPQSAMKPPDRPDYLYAPTKPRKPASPKPAKLPPIEDWPFPPRPARRAPRPARETTTARSLPPKDWIAGLIELRSFETSEIQTDRSSVTAAKKFQLALVIVKRNGQSHVVRTSRVFILESTANPSPDALRRLGEMRTFATSKGLDESLKADTEPWFAYRYASKTHS